MGTEVLRPQDCFGERFRDPPCRRRNISGSFSYTSSFTSSISTSRPVGRKTAAAAAAQKRRDASTAKRLNPKDEAAKGPKTQHNRSSPKTATQLVMEKVVILRRGESLDSKIKSLEISGNKDLAKSEFPKQVFAADLTSPLSLVPDLVFAGSACAVSPEPSSLPLPSFSKKKHILFDDFASKDLRRLLRLEF